MDILKKTPIILILLIVALIAIIFITPYTTNADNHAHTMEQIDREIDSVLKLTAGATAASAGISLLPDDQCTPIAEEFAELGKYFLVVLSALYLEKYLLTMVGFVSFSVLVPLACAFLGVGLIFNRSRVRLFSAKLFICALAVYFAVPVGVLTSEKVYSAYEENIDQTISIAGKISVIDEDASGIEKFVSWIENAAGTIVDYVTGLLSRFVEAIAVMIVTSCLIPILVIIFFIWLIKMLFNVDMTMSDAAILLPKKR